MLSDATLSLLVGRHCDEDYVRTAQPAELCREFRMLHAEIRILKELVSAGEAQLAIVESRGA